MEEEGCRTSRPSADLTASQWIHDQTETASAPLSRPLQRDPGGDAPATPLDIARLFVLRIQTLGIVWFSTDDA